ncbi:MAG: Glu/Leu/Phe/Val family dehydrogenase [Candidatus Hydrogenedentales bacterium]|jgi:glutamate dehydrogenase (NAD(P)+)
MKFGNTIEEYVHSNEPQTRSGMLLIESARRLRIKSDDVAEIIKPYTVHIQRLPVPLMGKVINLTSGVVLHNRARGPYKGGIRIAKDVDIWETTELARLMTLKTALADMDLGGGKSGISVDLRALHAAFQEEKRFNGNYREFARVAKADIMVEFTSHFGWLFSRHKYIPAPDMGSGAAEMARIYNATLDPASVTGKPDGVEGWLPGRSEATGYGIWYTILKDMERRGQAPDQCTAAIQGFGNVGMHAATALQRSGVRIVGIVDLTGGISDPGGLDVQHAAAHYERHSSFNDYKARSLTSRRLFRLPVDYLIPAATGHVIHASNADEVKARVVVEGANMPVTFDAMKVLAEKGVDLIPDIYANAGGVIASHLEFRQALSGQRFTRAMTLAHIRERFDATYEAMQPFMKKGRSMAEASIDVALQRVHLAMTERELLAR